MHKKQKIYVAADAVEADFDNPEITSEDTEEKAPESGVVENRREVDQTLTKKAAKESGAIIEHKVPQISNNSPTGPQREVKQSRNIAEEREMELMNKLIAKVESIEELDGLRALAQDCHDVEYIVKTKKGVEDINGKLGSLELANAFNSKKDVLVFALDIKDASNNEYLDKLASRIGKAGYTRKETTGNYFNNWIAHIIEGKTGSEKLTNVLNNRREELSLEDKLTRISRAINAINDEKKLEVFVYNELHDGKKPRSAKMVKKITVAHATKENESDWDVVEIEGKPGSGEVVEMIKDRRGEIPREKEERARKAKERKADEARKRLQQL